MPRACRVANPEPRRTHRAWSPGAYRFQGFSGFGHEPGGCLIVVTERLDDQGPSRDRFCLERRVGSRWGGVPRFERRVNAVQARSR